MKTNQNPLADKEFLEHLSDAIAESYLDDPDAMRALFAEEGIDREQLIARGRARIADLQREQRLLAARTERREVLRQLKERITNAPKLTGKQLIEEIEKIADSKLVLAFHRKLESMSDEDRQSFLEDLEILKFLDSLDADE